MTPDVKISPVFITENSMCAFREKSLEEKWIGLKTSVVN